MSFINEILCLVQDFLSSLFGVINDSLGALFDFELTVPDLGCEE